MGKADRKYQIDSVIKRVDDKPILCYFISIACFIPIQKEKILCRKIQNVSQIEMLSV